MVYFTLISSLGLFIYNEMRRETFEGQTDSSGHGWWWPFSGQHARPFTPTIRVWIPVKVDLLYLEKYCFYFNLKSFPNELYPISIWDLWTENIPIKNDDLGDGIFVCEIINLIFINFPPPFLSGSFLSLIHFERRTSGWVKCADESKTWALDRP